MTPPTTAFDNLDLAPDVSILEPAEIRFVFEFPELLERFAVADAVAGRSRAYNRRAGVVGVLLVLLSLLYASSAPLRPEADSPAVTTLGFAAATMGFIGTLMGLSGLRKRSSRSAWLSARLQTEALRLFHFSYIVARLPELDDVARDATSRERYLSGRFAALQHLVDTHFADLDRTLAQVAERGPSSLFDGIVELQAPSSGASPSMAAVVRAWQTIRLDWQLSYCEAKLALHRTGSRMSSAQQEHAFSVLGWSCVGVILLLHALHLAEGVVHIPAPPLEVAIVSVALVALAGRVVEDGLRVQREVERYEQYRAKIQATKQRFGEADGLASQLEVMRAFESVSQEEARVFFRSHRDARFLL